MRRCIGQPTFRTDLDKPPVLITIDSSLRHAGVLGLIHLLRQCGQVNGREVGLLQQHVQTVLGT